LRSGARVLRRSPSSSRNSLPVSTAEWIPSATIAALPVMPATMNLATAMPRLAAIAA
jgi:hypothetical protein